MNEGFSVKLYVAVAGCSKTKSNCTILGFGKGHFLAVQSAHYEHFLV